MAPAPDPGKPASRTYGLRFGLTAAILGGLTLAAFGYINPIVAAIMHNAGSLVVVFNSARLVRQGEELEPFEKPAPAGAAPSPPPGAPAPVYCCCSFVASSSASA